MASTTLRKRRGSTARQSSDSALLSPGRAQSEEEVSQETEELRKEFRHVVDDFKATKVRRYWVCVFYSLPYDLPVVRYNHMWFIGEWHRLCQKAIPFPIRDFSLVLFPFQ